MAERIPSDYYGNQQAAADAVQNRHSEPETEIAPDFSNVVPGVSVDLVEFASWASEAIEYGDVARAVDLAGRLLQTVGPRWDAYCRAACIRSDFRESVAQAAQAHDLDALELLAGSMFEDPPEEAIRRIQRYV